MEGHGPNQAYLIFYVDSVYHIGFVFYIFLYQLYVILYAGFGMCIILTLMFYIDLMCYIGSIFHINLMCYIGPIFYVGLMF